MEHGKDVAGDHKKSLLRFITCGSVDDGKSTLIGRLLFDAQLVLDDHLAAVGRLSRRYGTTNDSMDLALLVDGLEAEREQGITIDVAYRYFSTAKRSFIVADTPGHEQYTRNMATGASTAELAIILVDARKGVLDQTMRHARICALLGIRNVVLAVNKIDLVAFAQSAFEEIVRFFITQTKPLGFEAIVPVPVSARDGDNITTLSNRTPWYAGPTLLGHLETIEVKKPTGDQPFRFPVQWVNRPNLDFRGLTGTVASGMINVGEPIVVANSGKVSTVARIVTFDGDLLQAHAGMAVTLVLADDIDATRGDVLSAPDQRPTVADQFNAHLMWMHETNLAPGRSYWLMCGHRVVPAQITRIKHIVDINSEAELKGETLELNDIAVVNIATGVPIAFDPYSHNRTMGAFTLISRDTNATVGAGMINHTLNRATNIHFANHSIKPIHRAEAKNQRPRVLWFTGFSGSGKSTIADLVERELHSRGFHTMLLDGDNLRHGLNRDLGFTEADRVENIRRVGEVTRLMVDAGLILICCFISPYIAERQDVRAKFAEGDFIEVFVDAPIEHCIARDPKGLYKKALEGKIKGFTGISAPYEPSPDPELHIDSANQTPQVCVDQIIAYFLATNEV
jgi:bifunctional enzyme CysN/CysC